MTYPALSTSQDISAIKQLLIAVFKDDCRFYTDLFKLKYNDNVLIIKDNDIVASMAFLLPASILIGHHPYPICY
ncbi:MAG: GNAT family N-acetyltransferase, partial [Bacteroidales bacterium]|nr:GNAT family N-acetyltransferase [Bacteroidales bacterium]